MQRKIITRSHLTAVTLSPQVVPSRDQSLRLAKEQQGVSVNVSDEISATYGDLVQPRPSEPDVSLLYGRHPPSRYDGSVFAETSTGKYVANNVDQNRDTIPNPRLLTVPAAGHSNSPPD